MGVTLQVYVSEQITVRDIVHEIFEFIGRFAAWMFSEAKVEEEDDVKESVEQKEDEGRSPPDLGISVSEDVSTLDKMP
jgi:hypothetical protein